MTVENCGTYDVVLYDDKIVAFKSIEELIKEFNADTEYMNTVKNKLINAAKTAYSVFKNSNYKEDDIKEACVGMDFSDECTLKVTYDNKEHIYCAYDKEGKLVAKLHYIIDELEEFRRQYSRYELLTNSQAVSKLLKDKFIKRHKLSEVMDEPKQFHIPWEYKPEEDKDITVYCSILRRPEMSREEFYSSHINNEETLKTYIELIDKDDNKSMAYKLRVELDIILTKIKSMLA